MLILRKTKQRRPCFQLKRLPRKDKDMAKYDEKYRGNTSRGDEAGSDVYAPPAVDDMTEPGGDSANPASTPSPGGAAAQDQPESARDRFRDRIAADYPDLDMDDEDAYYDAANDRYDELKNFRASTKNFRDALNLDADQRGTFNAAE